MKPPYRHTAAGYGQVSAAGRVGVEVEVRRACVPSVGLGNGVDVSACPGLQAAAVQQQSSVTWSVSVVAFPGEEWANQVWSAEWFHVQVTP